MHIFPKTKIDFLSLKKFYFLISGLLLAVSIASIAYKGINYGIDFKGGIMVQLTSATELSTAQLREALEKSDLVNAEIQHYTGTQTYSIRFKTDSSDSANKLEVQLNAIAAALPNHTLTIENKQFVGPAVGKHLFRQALWAIVLSLLAIIIYLTFRFANPIWGFAGILALFHDILATVGLFSFLQAEVDLMIVTALLTIAGYSINDTIVIFDRIRENSRLMAGRPMDEIVNASLNETLSRTFITNGTVFVVVTILFLFGGKVIHTFAMAMVFGSIVGTYSTFAIAAPLINRWLSKKPSTFLQPTKAKTAKAKSSLS